MFLQKSRGHRGDEGHIWQKKGGVRETGGNHPLVRVAGGGHAEAGYGLLLFWFLATSCLSSTHLLVWSVRCRQHDITEDDGKSKTKSRL